jgi:hypothetical protein
MSLQSIPWTGLLPSCWVTSDKPAQSTSGYGALDVVPMVEAQGWRGVMIL